MQKLISFYIVFFVSIVGFSQKENSQTLDGTVSKDTTYIDEDGISISKETFNTKLNSNYFYAKIYHIDDYSVGKLQWSHYFGTLDEALRHQFFSLLSEKYLVDTTKVMAIHYKDTLKNPDSFSKKDKIIELDKRKHIHLISYKTFIKEYKDCHKRFKKNEHANVYHFYSHNNGHPEVVDKMSWHQDYQHKIKFLFSKNDEQPAVILLHPNGNYLIHYRYDGLYSNNILTQLKKNERWDIFLTDFHNKTSALNSYKKHLVTVDN